MERRLAVVALLDKEDKKARAIRILKKVLVYVLLCAIAVYMVFPFYWTIVISFRPFEQLTHTPVKFYPNSFTLEGYKAFFKENIFQYMGNTLLVVVVIMIVQLTLCSLGGYSLAKLKCPGRKGLVKFFFASMMLPGIISLIPQFMVVNSFGFYNSYLGIIAPATYSIYGCLFMRSFFISTPSEIAEAARIDGAGELRIFAQIFLPMVAPGLITLALFTFNGNWNNYLWPKLIAPRVVVMPVAMEQFAKLAGEKYNQVMAGAMITVLPSILIFIIGQKYFMDNLTFAGIK